MSKWSLIIDVARCINCNNCVLATKDEYAGNAFPGYTAAHPTEGIDLFKVDRHARGSGGMVDVTYMPRTCNHCDNAPCITAGGDGTVYKRKDGIVIIDPVRAKGRRDLVDACPYGAIAWNEAEQLPQNWIFDAHLLDEGWKVPRCVQACPTKAIEAVRASDEDFAARVAAEGLVVHAPELGTRPRVYYRNYGRISNMFIGGNVVARDGCGRLENVAGALVELRIEGRETVYRAETDAFGDFKIDGLPATEHVYVLTIAKHYLGMASFEGRVAGAGVNLGSLEIIAGQLDPLGDRPAFSR